MGQMFMYDQYLTRHATSDFEVFNLDDVDEAFSRITPLKYQQTLTLEGLPLPHTSPPGLQDSRPKGSRDHLKGDSPHARVRTDQGTTRPDSRLQSAPQVPGYAEKSTRLSASCAIC